MREILLRSMGAAGRLALGCLNYYRMGVVKRANIFSDSIGKA
jgi:hypothetical protein